MRLATEEYSNPTPRNLNRLCQHLTNYAINKLNPKFIYNQHSEEDYVGHKRSLKYLNLCLENSG